ncbi:peptide/nickel transport system ATP-binding protein [Nakamurella sp. UYEF19]|uniref:ABC transporter ATP-binding protein n=1 Tax=Nakamurella sp. UYEF19 TaxID=1756392 RepID=UPI0033984146
MSVLTFDDVTVTFGHGANHIRAVDGFDLTIGENTIVGLVGESGSGKSTVAKAAVGLTRPSRGQILLDGRDVGAGRRDAARDIQMVFQDPYSSLDPRMTVGASIGEALLGVRSRLRRVRVGELLERVGLDPALATALPSLLSGGQRQRVALARALAVEPTVLIADEITSALDASVQGSVLNLLRDLQRQLAMSVLFISHNLATVRYVSDVIAVMYLGRCVEIAPAEELMCNPSHPYTRTLLESAPRMGARIEPSGTDDALEHDVPDPGKPPSGCRFHPRCPVGPRSDPSRTICVDVDPQSIAADRSHQAACHFAGVAAGLEP